MFVLLPPGGAGGKDVAAMTPAIAATAMAPAMSAIIAPLDMRQMLDGALFKNVERFARVIEK